MLDETAAQQDEKLLMEYKAILHTQIEKLMPGLDDVVRRIMEGLKKVHFESSRMFLLFI